MIWTIERYNPNVPGEDLLSFLTLALGIISWLDINGQQAYNWEFRDKFLKFSWNSIVYPRDGSWLLKNICKLIISSMISWFDVFGD